MNKDKHIFLLLFCITLHIYSIAMQSGKKDIKFKDISGVSLQVAQIVAPYVNNKEMWYRIGKFKHNAPIVDACFGPHNNIILSATQTKLYEWDGACIKKVGRSKDNIGLISSIGFNVNQTKFFIKAGCNDAIFITSEFDSNDSMIEDNKEKSMITTIQCLNAKQEICPIRSVSFSEEGTLLSTSIDNAVYLWNIAVNPAQLLRIITHKEDVASLVFNGETPTKLITCSNKHNTFLVSLWDSKTGKLFLSVRHIDRVFGALLNTEETLLVTRSGSVDDNVMIWSAITGKLIKKIKNFNTRVINLFFNKDETELIMILEHGDVRMCNIETLEEGVKMNIGADCDHAMLNENDTYLVSVSKEGIVELWDMISYKKKARINHQEPLIRNLATNYLVNFNKDETKILTTYNTTAFLWQRYNDFTVNQLWLLYRLHTWYLLQKPNQSIINSLSLLEHVAKDMHYKNRRLFLIWKTFPRFVRRGIWRSIESIIKEYGSKRSVCSFEK